MKRFFKINAMFPGSSDLFWFKAGQEFPGTRWKTHYDWYGTEQTATLLTHEQMIRWVKHLSQYTEAEVIHVVRSYKGDKVEKKIDNPGEVTLI